MLRVSRRSGSLVENLLQQVTDSLTAPISKRYGVVSLRVIIQAGPWDRGPTPNQNGGTWWPPHSQERPTVPPILVEDSGLHLPGRRADSASEDPEAAGDTKGQGLHLRRKGFGFHPDPRQIVELPLRSLDVFVMSYPDAAQRAAAIVVLGINALAINLRGAAAVFGPSDSIKLRP